MSASDMNISVKIPASPTPIMSLVDCLESTAQAGLTAWVLAVLQGMLEEAPDSSLAQPWPLWPSRE